MASEVRGLAQRSSQAARDIKRLIVHSSSQIHDGVELVNRAGRSLTEILASIQTVADIVADIAHASSEQAGGIDHIKVALTQMDELTQKNSALVEENAATAKTLEEQSIALDGRVAGFQLDAVGASGPISAAHQTVVRRPFPVGQMQTALAARAARAE